MLTSEHYDKDIIRQQIDLCEDQINFKKFVDIFQMANIGDSVNEWLFTLYDKGTSIHRQTLKAISRRETSKGQLP
jgi:hypothetical protein